jgi:hypothetical protein
MMARLRALGIAGEQGIGLRAVTQGVGAAARTAMRLREAFMVVVSWVRRVAQDD